MKKNETTVKDKRAGAVKAPGAGTGRVRTSAGRGRKGFSLVEFVSNCPTNWGLTPQESIKFIKEKMLPDFPLGEFRNR